MYFELQDSKACGGKYITGCLHRFPRLSFFSLNFGFPLLLFYLADLPANIWTDDAVAGKYLTLHRSSDCDGHSLCNAFCTKRAENEYHGVEF